AAAPPDAHAGRGTRVPGAPARGEGRGRRQAARDRRARAEVEGRGQGRRRSRVRSTGRGRSRSRVRSAGRNPRSPRSRGRGHGRHRRSVTMADISAKDVAALRKITGAGMMDCKQALAETDGDVEKAKDWLREKGIAGA